MRCITAGDRSSSTAKWEVENIVHHCEALQVDQGSYGSGNFPIDFSRIQVLLRSITYHLLSFFSGSHLFPQTLQSNLQTNLFVTTTLSLSYPCIP